LLALNLMKTPDRLFSYCFDLMNLSLAKVLAEQQNYGKCLSIPPAPDQMDPPRKSL